MPEESLPILAATTPLSRLTGGRLVARNFLAVLAAISTFIWVIISSLELYFAFLLLPGLRLEDVLTDANGILAAALPIVDLAALYYLRRSYVARCRHPQLNRLVIFTALSFVLPVIPSLLNFSELLAWGSSQFIVFGLLRGPVILAVGSSYLLHRIPWHGNFPSQR